MLLLVLLDRAQQLAVHPQFLPVHPLVFLALPSAPLLLLRLRLDDGLVHFLLLPRRALVFDLLFPGFSQFLLDLPRIAQLFISQLLLGLLALFALFGDHAQHLVLL